MRYRLIIAKHLRETVKPWEFVREFDNLSKEELLVYNKQGYNIYYFPNHNSKKLDHNYLNSRDIDTFDCVFVDMDLKDGVYKDKQAFLDFLSKFELAPTKIIDSGHGIHSYWNVKDLTKEDLCHIQKRLIKKLKTDNSIWTVLQPMRLEGYKNTKNIDEDISCVVLKYSSKIYTCDQFYKVLPELDERGLKSVEKHLNKVSGKVNTVDIQLTGEIPEKFIAVLEKNPELNELYYNPVDRSSADYRIVSCMYLGGFTKEECIEVISTTQKGLDRGLGYAVDTVENLFNNPPHEFDNDFSEMQDMFSEEFVLQQKKKEIQKYKIEQEHQKVVEHKSAAKKRGIYSLKGNKQWRKDHYRDSIESLKESIKNRLCCITDNLTQVVPLEGIEVILIGAETGSGKTTCSVNIVDPLIRKDKRILYLSTEERAEDVYSKVACLRCGWDYNKQKTWDEETWLALKKEIDFLVDDDKLVVVDNYTYGTDVKNGQVVAPLDLTSLEDFQMLLNSVKRDEEHFDLVIIDYISKIGTNNNKDQEWQVIYKTVKFIEEWCKEVKVPSIVFSQLKNKVNDNDSFQTRLPGSKRILNAVTCAVEVVTDYSERTSKWICHKNRKYGKKFIKTLKFDRGKYIDFEGEGDSLEIDGEE